MVLLEVKPCSGATPDSDFKKGRIGLLFGLVVDTSGSPSTSSPNWPWTKPKPNNKKKSLKVRWFTIMTVVGSLCCRLRDGRSAVAKRAFLYTVVTALVN
jgi:hypothetical protein